MVPGSLSMLRLNFSIYSLEACIGWLFPHYNQWCMEQQSDNGDKQISSQNFLYHLIPFLTYVAIQDAPYWLRHFPSAQI